MKDYYGKCLVNGVHKNKEAREECPMDPVKKGKRSRRALAASRTRRNKRARGRQHPPSPTGLVEPRRTAQGPS